MTALIISPFEEDQLFLERPLRQCGWETHTAYTCAQGLAFLLELKPSLVLCECDLPGGGWNDIWDVSAALPDAPSLIVASRFADDSLWSEVLNLGGFDVLAKPFDTEEVARVIGSATRQRLGVRPQKLPPGRPPAPGAFLFSAE